MSFLAKSQLLAKLNSRLGLPTFRTTLAFIKLRQTFIEVSIFHYFDSKRYILVQTNALDYIIDRVLI